MRTSNPIESTFATVRLRTDKTKGCLSRETALALRGRLACAALRTRQVGRASPAQTRRCQSSRAADRGRRVRPRRARPRYRGKSRRLTPYPKIDHSSGDRERRLPLRRPPVDGLRLQGKAPDPLPAQRFARVAGEQKRARFDADDAADDRCSALRGPLVDAVETPTVAGRWPEAGRGGRRRCATIASGRRPANALLRPGRRSAAEDAAGIRPLRPTLATGLVSSVPSIGVGPTGRRRLSRRCGGRSRPRASSG